MALIYNASDVYTETRDLSQELAGVETSGAATVYAGKRGRLEPQLFTSDQEWLDYNDYPDATISMAGFTARRFLRSGSGLWAVRAIGSGYSFGGVLLQKPAATPITLVSGSENDPRDGSVDWDNAGGATLPQQNMAYFFADGPGSYSNKLAIEIVSANLSTPAAPALAVATTGNILPGDSAVGTLPASTYSYKITAINNTGESLPSAAASVTTTGTNKSVKITPPAVAGAAGFKIYGRTSGAWLLIATVGLGKSYYLDTGTITPAGAVPSTQTFTNEFTVKVYDDGESTLVPVETFVCTLVDQIDGFGQQEEIESRINGFSRYVRVKSNAAAFVTLPTVYSCAKTYLSSGSSGAAVTNTDIATAWNQLIDEDRYSFRTLINGGYANPTVQLSMINLAQTRGDCFAILDTPSTANSAQTFIDYRKVVLNVNTNRAALYGPDLLVSDDATGRALYIPPSGDVAATFAYTDRVTYPWFSPAGPNRGVVLVEGVRVKYNRIERDMLQSNQCNYVFSAPGLGIAVWEARTLQSNLSALSFINVRRLADNIAIAVRKNERVFLQEPNDLFTRLQIKESISRYLDVVQQARGISQYAVVISDKNNRPNITANGQLQVDVIITPILPVEKLVVRISVTRQGVNIEELIANGALN